MARSHSATAWEVGLQPSYKWVCANSVPLNLTFLSRSSLYDLYAKLGAYPIFRHTITLLLIYPIHTHQTSIFIGYIWLSQLSPLNMSISPINTLLTSHNLPSKWDHVMVLVPAWCRCHPSGALRLTAWSVQNIHRICLWNIRMYIYICIIIYIHILIHIYIYDV